MDATVYKVKKDGDDYRVIFFLDVYYKSFAASREEDMKVVASDSSGLIVSNKAIVEKNGKKGVYVKNKNRELYLQADKGDCNRRKGFRPE